MLRVEFTVHPPMVEQCALKSHLCVTRSCPHPGFNSEYMCLLLRYMNVTYTLINAEAFDPNERLSRFDALRLDYADVLMKPSTPTPNRLNDFSSSNVFLHSQVAVVGTSQSSEALNLWAASLTTMMVFTPYVWTFILFMYLMLRMLRWFHSTVNIRIYPKLEWVYIVLGILMALYQSSLLGQLLVPNDRAQFDGIYSMIKLIENQKLKMIVTNNSAKHMWIRTATEGVWFRLQKSLEQHPPILLNDNDPLETVIPLLQTGQAVLLTSSTSAPSIRNTHCSLRYMILSELGGDADSFWFQNKTSSAFMRRFDKALIRFGSLYEGLFQKYLHHRIPRHSLGNACPDIKQASSSIAFLTMKQLGGAFVILITGFTTACALAAAEVLVKICDEMTTPSMDEFFY